MKDCPPLVSKIQKNGIKVVALTHCITGRFGRISSAEDWRLQELKNLGYNFEKSWKEFGSKLFPNLISKNRESYPCYNNGVIFTNDVPKGVVLKEFLNYVKLRPGKIIFIDDNKEHLESMEEFAKKTSILYLGIHYTAAQDNKIIEDFNHKRAKIQFDTLCKEKKWLCDEEANARTQEDEKNK